MTTVQKLTNQHVLTLQRVPPRNVWKVAEGSMCRKRLSKCTVQELWLDKGAVCIDMGLYQPARSLLAEAHLVAKVREDTYKIHILVQVPQQLTGCMFQKILNEIPCVFQELGDQTTLAKSFYLLAVLASQEQHHGQALALLEQAQEIGGDEDFWYNLIQTLLNTTAHLEGDIYTQVQFLYF